MPRPRGARIRPDGGIWGFEAALQRRGFARVAGVDEAGRGACAGPLVVAAVVLPPVTRAAGRLAGIGDSKELGATAREALFPEVLRVARAWSVVVVEAYEVDVRGVHDANVGAMRRAVMALDCDVDYVITDGFPVGGMPASSLGVWKGDQVVAAVAAASVVAKVTRDRIMVGAARDWPAYGFERHKGYSTPEHRAALLRHGPCPIHRRSFSNVRTTEEQP